MIFLYYILIAPCALSALGCTVFLYSFFRYQSISLTFGMKHVAILESLDLIYSLLILAPISILSNQETFCQIAGLIVHFSLISQSLWTSNISLYIYQTNYLKIPKDSITTIKPLIFTFLISTSLPVLCISLNCYKEINENCSISCEPSIKLPIFILTFLLIISSFIFSVFASIKVMKKLKKDMGGSWKQLKWSMLRHWVYPYITLICTVPGAIASILIPDPDSASLVIQLTINILFCLIGFFNSIALGFTPEFKQAWSLQRGFKQALIN